jgi:hypothetical protein
VVLGSSVFSSLRRLSVDARPRQPARSFADLQQRVRPGHTIYVIDTTGTETRAKVVEVTPTALSIDVAGNLQRLEEARVRQVQRYGDSLWNGTLIGIALGLPGTFLADPPRGPCDDDPQRQCAKSPVEQRIVGLSVMGAIGAGIDALMRSRHQVYLAPGQPVGTARRLQLMPRVSPIEASPSVVIR